MTIECDPKLSGGTIRDTKTKEVEIFYEGGLPYLRYSGSGTMDVKDGVIPYIMEMPKIDLQLDSLEWVGKEEMCGMAPLRIGDLYIKFKIIEDIKYKVDEEEV